MIRKGRARWVGKGDLVTLLQNPARGDPAVQAEVQKYVSVVRPSAFMVGIAFPGTFLLDARGRVTQRVFEDFYIERNTVSNLLIKLGGKTDAAVAGTRISTAHLEVTTYPSTEQIAPGDRFSVVTEIEPHAKIHVYAPGAKGYRVVSLAMNPNLQVKLLPLEYPA